jgi:hypothetical protein
MLRYSAPPGYRREQAVKRPKLGPWLGAIDAILEDDKNRPIKQILLCETARAFHQGARLKTWTTVEVNCMNSCGEYGPEGWSLVSATNGFP